MESRLYWERGHRVNVETRLTGISEAAPVGLISDGSRMIQYWEGGSAEEKTPGNLDRFLLRGLLWSGKRFFMSGLSSMDEETLEKDLSCGRLTDFRIRDRNPLQRRNAICVSYMIREDRPGTPPAQVLLWIDGRTQLPIRRETTITSGKELRIVETFLDAKVDETIDPARFTVGR